MSKVLNKVLTQEGWEDSVGKDRLALSKLDIQDNFVHFSLDEQLFKTLNKFYPNQVMVVVRVDADKLVGDLRYETNPGGSNKYYHLYDGFVPMESVISVYKIEPVKNS